MDHYYVGVRANEPATAAPCATHPRCKFWRPPRNNNSFVAAFNYAPHRTSIFMPSTPKHWNYFLAVETELVSCARYVEFAQENFSCYSNEFSKLIVLAASEVDSILQELCAELSPSSKAKNITEYYPILLTKYPFLTTCEITIPRYQLTLCPWRNWTRDQRPEWWSKSYNKLKHERYAHFRNATLEATLNAVGAQFLALQLYHHETTGEYVEVDLAMRSALFSPKLPDAHKGGAFWGYGDPFAYLRCP